MADDDGNKKKPTTKTDHSEYTRSKGTLQLRPSMTPQPPSPSKYPLSDVFPDEEASTLPSSIWAKMLRPLKLIDCIKLELVCSAWVTNIYTGQHRFVWNKKFKDFLFCKYNINQTEASMNDFLIGVARKIGPHCSQVIIKLHSITEAFNKVLAEFVQLRSLYVQVQYESKQWYYLINMTDAINSKHMRELRLWVKRYADYNTPPLACSNMLTQLAPNLESFQFWQQEEKFIEQLSKMVNLRQMRLFADELAYQTTKSTLFRLAQTRPELTRLYIKWQADQISADKVRLFTFAMAKFTQLQALSLEINWVTFAFRDHLEGEKFLQCLDLLCKNLSVSIRKLSIDVQHTIYRKQIVTNAELIRDIAWERNLKLLRVVASGVDTFPLQLNARQLNTVELSFKYIKIYREIGEIYNLAQSMPKRESADKYLFDLAMCPTETMSTVRALKLVHCPVFDTDLMEHLSKAFPKLELFSFQALHKATYMTGAAMKGALAILLQNMPNLRVLKLDDTFPKPDLSQVVSTFLNRARKNPNQLYAVYLDKKKFCNQEDVLIESAIQVSNLRVY